MAHIAGTGRYLPSRILANDELAESAGVTDAWIRRRTGIRERRIAGPDEGTAFMGARAAERALRSAGVPADDVELILVATSTPDHLTPPTACEIQLALGAFGAACFDIEAGFAGWLYALITADALMRAGTVGNALVVGAEKLSVVTDRSDPQTGPLFGDGAGAILLAAGDGPLRVRSTSWWADGRLATALVRPAGGARRPFDERVLEERAHLLRMEGPKLFRQAVRTMAAQAEIALRRAEVAADDVGLIIPHQANLRIIEGFARALGAPPDRVYVNIGRYGNTGAATLPIALAEAVAEEQTASGRPVLLAAFGAGATAGAALLEGGAPARG